MPCRQPGGGFLSWASAPRRGYRGHLRRQIGDGQGLSGRRRDRVTVGGGVPDPRRRLRGSDIVILEEQDQLGGSLDAAGSPDTGYTMRGGRMFEVALPLHLRPAGHDPLARRPRRSRSPRTPSRSTRTSPGTTTRAWSTRTARSSTRPLDGLLRARPAGTGEVPGHPGAAAGRQADHRLLQRGLLHHELLVHVVHHLRLRALAQRDRVPPLPQPLRPPVPDLRHHVGDLPHPLQPVRLDRAAAGQPG